MRGDSIVIEEHHIRAAEQSVKKLLPQIKATDGRFTLTVGGESGSGKSEIAMAIANVLKDEGLKCVILQQDDFYVYPPRTNDAVRRKDINWVGTQEVKLDEIDRCMREFLDGANSIDKPLVDYNADKITIETIDVSGMDVAIAEGTYTSASKNAMARVFIDRSFEDTRAHRIKRNRHASELDEFTEKVLIIEHDIISSHKALASVIINTAYNVEG